MQLSRSAILRYALLPEFLPRIFAFFKSGFSNIAYLIAVIFEGTGLLPKNHPYLNPANFGKFGIRHVLMQGADRLVFSKKHLDQIIIYFTILTGLVLIATQFVLLIVAFAAEKPAYAQIDMMKDILSVNSKYNPGPEQDIAFIIMDRVFGAEGIFESCISEQTQCLDHRGNPTTESTPQFPFPTHKALHLMLQFYSYGIFIISVLVILYFVARLAAETAETGVPFGEKANKTWVPVRLIVFLGLLIPLNLGGTNAGLNAAQLITLWSAKLGSNFATNGWGKFIDESESEFLGKPEDLIAQPNIPELGELVKFMFVAKTCKIAEEMAYRHDIQPYIIREKQPKPLVPGEDARLMSSTNYTEALKFANYGNIAIRFGVKGPENSGQADEYNDYKGRTDPLCGELKLTTTGGGNKESGTQETQILYYNMINDMWRDSKMTKRAECVVRRKFQMANGKECNEELDKDFAIERITKYQNDLKEKLPELINKQVQSGDWDISEQLKKKGWGGAAIWYNRVAELNGEVTTAIFSMPQPSQYPKVLEATAYQHIMMSDEANPADVFNPLLPNGQQVKYDRHKDKDIAKAMYTAYSFWNKDTMYKSDTRKPTGNFIIDAINFIFGTSGIFDIRKNDKIHPLAQLSTVGRGMMEASIRNLGLGILGEGGGMLLSGTSGKISDAGGKFLHAMGMATIAISFVLFYVLPFLPFIYFIFALGGWVKSIFEAIVAMPLWAMAHIIRIDGEGIPGQAASNGYFLILEIFLRPILTLIGLLGSIVVFSSLVVVLNDIFNTVVENVSGFNLEEGQQGNGNTNLTEFMRGPVDEFFFTAMYTVMVYILALGSFKLIDQVPNYILRFIGSSTTTLQETDKDPAGGLIEQTYRGTNIVKGNLSGGALAALVG